MPLYTNISKNRGLYRFISKDIHFYTFVYVRGNEIFYISKIIIR